MLLVVVCVLCGELDGVVVCVLCVELDGAQVQARAYRRRRRRKDRVRAAAPDGRVQEGVHSCARVRCVRVRIMFACGRCMLVCARADVHVRVYLCCAHVH